MGSFATLFRLCDEMQVIRLLMQLGKKGEIRKRGVLRVWKAVTKVERDYLEETKI